MSSLFRAPLDRLLDPFADCLTADVARRLAELRPDTETQARINILAAKANAGKLTSADRDEYEEFVEAIDIVSIIQAKARKVLAVQKT